MAPKTTSEVNHNLRISGTLDCDGAANFDGATTLTGAVSASTITLTSTLSASQIKLTQTLGGTDVVAIWSTAGAPALTTGMFYFTLTYGASTFRVPCWPTT